MTLEFLFLISFLIIILALLLLSKKEIKDSNDKNVFSNLYKDLKNPERFIR